MAKKDVVGLICVCDMNGGSKDVFVEERMRPALALTFQHSCRDALDLMDSGGTGAVILIENSIPRRIVTRGELQRRSAHAAPQVDVPRCRCCGTARALRNGPRGRTFCVQCNRVPRAHPQYLVGSAEFAAPA